MPAPHLLPIAIGRAARAAHLKFLHALYAQVQIDTPAESAARERDRLQPAPDPPPPFATQDFLTMSGDYILECWLEDGPHPPGCMWCESLAVWMLLRRRVPVARSRGGLSKLR